MALLKQTGLIAWFVGIAALIGLTLWSGAGLVVHAMASVGWGVLLVVLVRVVTVATAGAGWWLLIPSRLRPPFWTCILLRFIREAANALLPVAQCGGDLLGARLLTFGGTRGALAAASIIVDVLLQAATQLVFAMLGLLALVLLGGDHAVVRTAAIGLALAAVALGAFYLAQQRGGRRILQFMFSRFAGDRKWRVLGAVDAVYEYLALIYAGRASLTVSTIVHMAGWLIGVAEVMIALAFMGHPVGFAEALAIESLTHAVRGAAFAIPGALGAQEGGLVVLCAIFGIPPEQALALSLVKRVADLALGIPSLLAWQALEGAELRRSFSAGGPRT